MRRKKVERLYHDGVLTEKDYNDIMNGKEDKNGTLEYYGCSVDADVSYNLEFNIKNFNLLEVFKKKCTPWLGADQTFPNLFGKYGHTVSGMGYGFQWNDNLKNATEQELWEMLALSSMYWEGKYRESNKVEELVKYEYMTKYYKAIRDNYWAEHWGHYEYMSRKYIDE